MNMYVHVENGYGGIWKEYWCDCYSACCCFVVGLRQHLKLIRTYEELKRLYSLYYIELMRITRQWHSVARVCLHAYFVSKWRHILAHSMHKLKIMESARLLLIVLFLGSYLQLCIQFHPSCASYDLSPGGARGKCAFCPFSPLK